MTAKLRELQDQGVPWRPCHWQQGPGFPQPHRCQGGVASDPARRSPASGSSSGPSRFLLDAYAEGRINAVYLSYTKFINTVKQEPVVEQLLPSRQSTIKADENQHACSWDYIYEPDAQSVIDELLVRYVESLIYQAVAENMASEHSRGWWP